MFEIDAKDDIIYIKKWYETIYTRSHMKNKNCRKNVTDVIDNRSALLYNSWFKWVSINILIYSIPNRSLPVPSFWTLCSLSYAPRVILLELCSLNYTGHSSQGLQSLLHSDQLSCLCLIPRSPRSFICSSSRL